MITLGRNLLNGLPAVHEWQVDSQHANQAVAATRLVIGVKSMYWLNGCLSRLLPWDPSSTSGLCKREAL